jgi:chromosome transmission fidelity protein 4
VFVLWLFKHSCLSQIQKKIEEVALLGLDTTAFEDEAFNTEAALDRCILRLISTCCNGINT